MENTEVRPLNHTGVDMSPTLTKEMLTGNALFKVGPISSEDMAAIRSSYIRLKTSVGSVPLPGTLRGFFQTGKEKLTGHNPEVLINKLGQRLAFERTGVRLYDALIMKCEADQTSAGAGVIDVAVLQRFREEEAEHFRLVKEVMDAIGADPTAQTPDADVTALASLGVPKVLTEPRTSFAQCLNAILTAEMTDNAAWELLVELCHGMGQTETAQRFQQALEQESKHLEQIKHWLREMTLAQAKAV